MKYIIMDTDKPIVLFTNENAAKAFAREFEKVSSGTHYIHVEECREVNEFLAGAVE